MSFQGTPINAPSNGSSASGSRPTPKRTNQDEQLRKLNSIVRMMQKNYEEQKKENQELKRKMDKLETYVEANTTAKKQATSKRERRPATDNATRNTLAVIVWL